METLDAGKTWSVRSRGGQSDFHALTSSSQGVVAFVGQAHDRQRRLVRSAAAPAAPGGNIDPQHEDRRSDLERIAVLDDDAVLERFAVEGRYVAGLGGFGA